MSLAFYPKRHYSLKYIQDMPHRFDWPPGYLLPVGESLVLYKGKLIVVDIPEGGHGMSGAVYRPVIRVPALSRKAA